MNDPLLIDRVADTTSHRDREALDRAIVQLLREFLQAHAVTLYQLVQDGAERRLVRRAALDANRAESGRQSELDLQELPRLSDSAQWQSCIHTGQVVHAPATGGHVRSFFPVDGPHGIVGLLEIDAEDAADARDERLVRGILRILDNQTALLDYGERDTLTGLLNRKTFESRFGRLCRELKAAEAEEPRQSWLGLLDVDRFKSINDTYGHLFGDEVLLLVSQIMQRTLRGSDQLFRFGGEEFVVVLEGGDVAGAHIAFERIRAAIEHHRFPQVGTVTASLGYTRIESHDVPATCIERADAALYFVKHNGRNGVRSYEALVEAGELAHKAATSDVEFF